MRFRINMRYELSFNSKLGWSNQVCLSFEPCGLYYKIYDVIFRLSYRSKKVSVERIHRHLLSSVRWRKYDVVNSVILAIGRLYRTKKCGTSDLSAATQPLMRWRIFVSVNLAKKKLFIFFSLHDKSEFIIFS